MMTPKFTIKHVGVNTKNAEIASAWCKDFCDFFELPVSKETDISYFVGDLIEVMKHDHIGLNGHIALQTADVEEAIRYFKEKGIGIREETIRRDENGKIVFAYLDKELGGFAMHLTV